MNDLKVSLAFGAALVIGAGALFRWHWAQFALHRRNPALSNRERNFFERQFRRRVQVAFLIVLLGIFVPLLDYYSTNGSPQRFTALACGVLGLTLWIMILAVFDWISERVFRRALASRRINLNRMRRELEEEADRLRRGDSNGKPED
jgi:hypothetical protein